MSAPAASRPSSASRPRPAVARLAELILASEHCIFVTGAGISTNAGIRDYRGPEGIWTEAVKQGKVSGGAFGEPSEDNTPWDEEFYQLLPAARPTFTHRAITALARPGCADGREAPFVQHVITQNEDALHRRSGLPPAQLSELHGNAFIELCGKHAEGDSDSDLDSSSDEEEPTPAGKRAALKKLKLRLARQQEIAEAKKLRPAGCGAAVVRSFVTYYGDTYQKSNPAGRHVTRRACPHCRGAGTQPPPPRPPFEERPREGAGWLLDSTVDFGEMPGGFPWGANAVHGVKAAKEQMQRADLVVALGTTLSVLANYFDPWHPESKWAKPPPHGLRLAPPPPPPPSAMAPSTAAPPAKKSKSPRQAGKAAAAASKPRPCLLAIVSRGDVLDEELASVRIDDDVDGVMAELLPLLRVPPPPPYDPATDALVAEAVPPLEGEPAAPFTIEAALAAHREAEDSLAPK